MTFRQLVHNMIVDNFTWQMISPSNRRNIIIFLNKKFFPDKIAEFIDITSDLDIYTISLSVKYKNIFYSLIEFENNYLKINRIQKLNKINGRFYR